MKFSLVGERFWVAVCRHFGDNFRDDFAGFIEKA